MREHPQPHRDGDAAGFGRALLLAMPVSVGIWGGIAWLLHEALQRFA